MRRLGLSCWLSHRPSEGYPSALLSLSRPFTSPSPYPSIPSSNLLEKCLPQSLVLSQQESDDPQEYSAGNLLDSDQNPLPFGDHHRTISKLLKQFPDDPSTLQSALDQTGIQPNPLLIQNLVKNHQFSPQPIKTLYFWASKHPDFHPTASLLNSTVDVLAKARQFDSAWSLLLPHLSPQNNPSPIVSVDAFAVLIRRYARNGLPQAAIRTFEFMEGLGFENSDGNGSSDRMDLLLDALCKEGHLNEASAYFKQRRESETNRIFSVRIYNILLNGYFRLRKLKKAERLYEEMRRQNVVPTVVTFGTLVEGYCRMKRVEKAIELLNEMKDLGLEPNMIVYNPIVDGLAEAGRFKEALGMVERTSIHGLSPNISTFNSLVKGFCKAGDLEGASKILKMMVGRQCSPTSATYNYFFSHFAKFRKIEEGMNLYTKMVNSGYEPDRLTYHLLIKMLCKNKQLDLAVQVVKEMNTRGCDSDLATGTMLLHLLCKLHRLEEACVEFEGMIRRGLVPQYITYRMLAEKVVPSMVRRLSDLMGSIPHSIKLPDSVRDGKHRSREERTAVLRKAQMMSDMLKIQKKSMKHSKNMGSSEDAVACSNRLIADFQRQLFIT